MDLPDPAHGEVQIRVKALGLNRADALVRSNTYIQKWPLPAGLGLEASGIIEKVGEGVTGLTPGEAVSVIPSRSMARWPAYGELATFPAKLVVRHPPSLSWEAAAATWMQYVTAYGALIDIAKLRGEDFVVITAASSSVGLAAIEIVNMLGATAIAITRTSRKRQALLDFGASYVIASEEEDLAVRLKEIAGADGVRIVLDSVGGPAFEPLTAAMSQGGILIEYGGSSPEPTPFPLFEVLRKSLTLRGYLIHEIVGDPVKLEAAKRFVLDGLTSGSLKPTIAKIFPFDDIVAAHRFLESNEQFGKVVVTI
jgi:NADPH:quinone reductase-like Zn-dependent oxidoreductase